MIIGKSGSGKTTLAVQMGMNIIRNYQNGLMYLFDFEQNNTKERIRSVSGVSEEYYNDHCTILREGITTESVLRTLSKIKEWKLANEKEIAVPNENGIVDPKTGKVINILPPTVVIVDSLAMMLPADNLAEEDIQGSMSATAIAKVNSQFFKKSVQICNRANIILIFINHITQQISIGVTPVAAQLNYLK